MIWRVLGLAAVALLGYGIVAGVEQGSACKPQYLFQAEGPEGVVWANITLTHRRATEPYLPIVIGIQNTSRDSVKVTRESLWLNDLDGLVSPQQLGFTGAFTGYFCIPVEKSPAFSIRPEPKPPDV